MVAALLLHIADELTEKAMRLGSRIGGHSVCRLALDDPTCGAIFNVSTTWKTRSSLLIPLEIPMKTDDNGGNSPDTLTSTNSTGRSLNHYENCSRCDAVNRGR